MSQTFNPISDMKTTADLFNLIPSICETIYGDYGFGNDYAFDRPINVLYQDKAEEWWVDLNIILRENGKIIVKGVESGIYHYDDYTEEETVFDTETIARFLNEIEEAYNY